MTDPIRRMAAVVAALLTVACSSDGPTNVGPDTSSPAPPGPVTARVTCPFTGAQQSLQVLGCGAHGFASLPVPYTAEVAVHGNRAYTTTYAASTQINPGNYVNVWDVSGGTPVRIDTLVVPGAVARTSDIAISDDGALMVVSTEPAGTLAIYDRTAPGRPRLITNHPVSSGGVHTVKLARMNSRLYAFGSSSDATKGVQIVDLSVPASPVTVGRVPASNYIHDVFVRGGLLFAADWNAGVAIWDIGGGGRGGTVSAPVLVSRAYTLNGRAHNVWWFVDPTVGDAGARSRYMFVGEESPPSTIGVSATGDLHVVDLANIQAPQEVAALHVDGAGAHNFWMDEARGILYAAFYNGGVRAIDVRGDLSACTSDQRLPSGMCDLRRMGREVGVALSTGGAYIWGVNYNGDAVYASDMLNGIWKLKPIVR